MLYIDCVGGVAGDMVLAALVDAGCPLETVATAVAACGVDEVALSTESVLRGGMRARHLVIEEHGPSRERQLAGCLAAIDGSGLPARMRLRARAVLTALGEAEAHIHGVPVDQVHLHELSAADTLTDVIGICAALEALGVDEIRYGPVLVAPGTIQSAHGTMPLPAPATLALLTAAQAPLTPGTPGVEHTTPTGAALLTTLGHFGPPALRLRAMGQGAGSRDLPDRPNIVRVWLGEPLGQSPGARQSGAAGPAAGDGFDDACVELRTNLDDVSAAVVADLAERCMAAGAYDAWVEAATMRKGRPGHVLHVLVAPEVDAMVARLLLEQSPSLGVRRSTADRMVAGRDSVPFASPLGAVRVKRKHLDGRVIDARPEIEDCRGIAAETGLALHEVIDCITTAAREAFVLPRRVRTLGPETAQ